MRPTAKHKTLLAAAVAITLAAGTMGTSWAGIRVEATYVSEPVDVRVWLDRGYEDYYEDFDGVGSYYDVYPSADDVVLYVRAARSCYTTVYVIDTEGFIHVVHPFSPYGDAYLVGGRVYRIFLRDFGFHGGYFGRGVAFAFAVSSPFPFAYATYGQAVFGPNVGFQIYGDPFVAARLFYLSILPPTCQRGFIAVSYARFYVREYVRYPSYLCLGWCEHHGVHTRYSSECGVHRQYRVHAQDPYRVLRPASDPDRESIRYTRIAPSKGAPDVRVSKQGQDRVVKDPSDVRVSKAVQTRPAKGASDVRVSKALARTQGRVTEARPGMTERTGSTRVIVRSTKESYVASKQSFQKMREMFENSGPERAQTPVKSAVQAPAKTSGVRSVKSAKVDPRALNATREAVTLGDASPTKTGKSGSRAKRAK